jgi:hypothetical protein
MISEKLVSLMVSCAQAEFETLHLLATDRRLSDTDERIDLVEPTAEGYAPVELGQFTQDGGTAEHSEVVFRMPSNAGDVFGWFICDSDGSPVLSYRFSEPLQFGVMGAEIKVTPSFVLTHKATRAKV